MRVRARAPGKLVVLGEYAVLAGGPALVMAVDRYCIADLAASDDDVCHLSTIAGQTNERSFALGASSGAAIVDTVLEQRGMSSGTPWKGRLDSSALFVGARKLGLGSSAAALVAWAGAWSTYTRGEESADRRPSLAEVVAAHRRVQKG
ncbi:MAG: hypothetical protein GWN29_01640, partial [Gammaproteobacteria bacterium]|nr:hypothetical protein [Gammaproteobacteria bacterium]